MLRMLLQRVRINYNVVKLDSCKRPTIRKQDIHRPLEGSGGIAQSERHDSELETSEFGFKSRFWHILWANTYLVITL